MGAMLRRGDIFVFVLAHILSGNNLTCLSASLLVVMECNDRVLLFVAEWFNPHPQIVRDAFPPEDRRSAGAGASGAPRGPVLPRRQLPLPVRKILGASSFMGSGLACAGTAAKAAAHASLLVRGGPRTTFTFKECACCVIKPQALKGWVAGAIFNDILARSFAVSSVAAFRLERTLVVEFLKVYKGWCRSTAPWCTSCAPRPRGSLGSYAGDGLHGVVLGQCSSLGASVSFAV